MSPAVTPALFSYTVENRFVFNLFDLLLCGVIGLVNLPEPLQVLAPEGLSFRRVRAQQTEAVERPFLADLLRKHNGNVSEAAADARMTRKMIYRLAHKFGIDPAQFRGS